MILQEKDGGVSFSVVVSTRASRSAIHGVIGDTIKVRVNSPPAENKANSETLELLAKVFNIAKSNIEITQGCKSRRKNIFISNITLNRVKQILDEHII